MGTSSVFHLFIIWKHFLITEKCCSLSPWPLINVTLPPAPLALHAIVSIGKMLPMLPMWRRIVSHHTDTVGTKRWCQSYLHSKCICTAACCSQTMQNTKCPGSLMQAGHWVSCHTGALFLIFLTVKVKFGFYEVVRLHYCSYLSSWTERRGYFIPPHYLPYNIQLCMFGKVMSSQKSSPK